MRLRQVLSTSTSPIERPHTLGTTSLTIPVPELQDIGAIDDWEQGIFVFPADMAQGYLSPERSQYTHEIFSSLASLSSLASNYPQDINLSVSVDSINFQILFPQATLFAPHAGVKFDTPASTSIGLGISVFIQEQDFSFVQTDTSTNIFVELKNSLVKGKKYIEDEWKNAFKKVTSKHPHKEIRLESRTFQIPISKEDGSESSSTHTRIPSIPSFFDLIKPLLLPPPTFFTTNDDLFLPPGKKPYHYQLKGIEKLIENKIR